MPARRAHAGHKNHHRCPPRCWGVALNASDSLANASRSDGASKRRKAPGAYATIIQCSLNIVRPLWVHMIV